MKTSITSALALVLFATGAQAQQPEPSPNPVEEQEVDLSQDELPDEGSGEQVDAAPATVPIEAASEDEAEWDVMAPRGATFRTVTIDTDEGTWMDVDVSPDGRTLAFALLGDIYTMPIAGGTPTRIAEGLAWEVQPRFSPDGQMIAFISDRAGGDNLWLMRADGSDKRQVTKEDFRLINQPSWSPDGRYIAAKKHFTTQRSLGTGEIWLYHVSGGGGVQLVKRANESLQKELGEPIYAPNGNAIYYTRNVTPGNSFEYAQDSNAGIFAVERYDIDTGEVTTAISGYGGAVRPTPSPDGKHIAFVRRDKDRSQLWIKDLASGQERMIYDALDLDMQETWAVYGVYPMMDWMPDSSDIVVWAGGKLRRVAADGSGARDIPFRITDTRQVAEAPHPVIPVAPDSFTAKIPRFATVSPDGRTVVFESLGKLYVKPVGSDGAPRRLTSGDDNELELWPAWSRDGDRIAFVRWSDAGLGRIVTVDSRGRNERIVTRQQGHYAVPQFSPDGRTIAFEKRGGGYLTSPDFSQDEGVYTVPATGGTPTLIARDTSTPQYGSDNGRLFMVGQSDGKLQLLSSDLNGEARRVHVEGELANDFRVSPRGDYVAFRQNYEVFAMPLLPGGQAVSVSENASSLPVTKASKGGADYIGWAQGGDTLHWSMGPVLYRAATSQLTPLLPGDDAPKFVPPATGTSLERTIRADKASGTVAITGARIHTMAGNGAGTIENGTIVIEGDRIAAIGPAASVTVPRGARIVEAEGRTIIPGLVDAHAHGPQGTGDLIPQQNWVQIQQLAMGTTTIHDPSSSASMIFASAERQQAGMLLAPRIFSTGEIIYGAKAPSVYARIDSYDDALAHVRRIKAQGGISVKNYNQPRREQRQQVAAAARAENMLVVAEGGSLFGMDMNLIADGNSTLEHNIPVLEVYDDVLQFFGQSQTNYTPTLVVGYGGLAGDPYWRQATDVFAQPLLVAHTPPAILRAGNARRTTAPEGDFVDDDVARVAKRIADTGVLVSIGAHGQQAGIGTHWEIWSFVRGGMTPLEALQAATIVPARSLGMEREIGSLEPGKLADLVILDGDPLENIRNTERVDTVVLGGRAYDAATMNETVTGDARRTPYWWE